MKSEWQLLCAQQDHRFDKHIENIEESFRTFVQQSKEKTISTLTVL